MFTHVHNFSEPSNTNNTTSRSSAEDNTFIGTSIDNEQDPLRLHISNETQQHLGQRSSPSQTREQEYRLDDDLAVLQAERVVSGAQNNLVPSTTLARSRSRRTDPVDEFDVNTNPVHEKNALYRPPEHPTTSVAKIFRKVHESSFLVRYFMYITPISALLLIPLLLGALLFETAHVGGVKLLWFSVWLEIVWLTLWAGRIVAKMIPWPLGLVSSLFTNNSKKWRDMGKQLELPVTLFFWWLGVEISFLPTMQNHMVADFGGDTTWMSTVNRIIISVLVGATLNLFEKIIIQLIAISFHLRTYADRIEVNKFQIGSLVKLYQYSRKKIAMEDSDFEDDQLHSGPGSGTRTPMQYVELAQKNFTQGFRKVGDVAGKVAGDFTGKQVTKSTHPHQVVLMLLNSTPSSQVLARRLYRTFVQEDVQTVSSIDIKPAFDNEEEADAAFAMFDKDLNGDISMEELEAVCVEIGRERKSITASLKDLDSVISKLDAILLFVVVCVTILVLITLISTSAAGVLTSAGSTILALSWLFSATAQEFLQSIVFVFVKHPFDVGDRVSIYGNTGAAMKGDDYFVKEISLLYTEFKKMEGHVVQAPNSYLNTLFILNMRRSGGLAEAIPLTFKFGTTIDQIDELRNRLLEFVKAEKREYQGNILTEIRDIIEAHSVNLNVVFFYKSNWQNELLRLQRRNKFICAMMISIQEVGIEGPRMRLPGQKEEIPFYIHHPIDQPVNLAGGRKDDPGLHHGSLNQESPFVHSTEDHSGAHPQSSVLRQSNRPVHDNRGRGESVSSMARRVDFSLGMKDVMPSDMMGDVYNDNRHARVLDIARGSASRPRIIEEGDHDDASIGRSSAFDTQSVRSRLGVHRSATDMQPRIKSIQGTVHRNRFFGRNMRDTAQEEVDEVLTEQRIMEQGMAIIPETSSNAFKVDPRSGVISSQAIKLHTQSSIDDQVNRDTLPPRSSADRDEKVLVRSRTEDFEMTRLGS